MRKQILLATVAQVLTINAARAQKVLPNKGKNTINEVDGGTKKTMTDIKFRVDGAVKPESPQPVASHMAPTTPATQ